MRTRVEIEEEIRRLSTDQGRLHTFETEMWYKGQIDMLNWVLQKKKVKK